MSSRYYTSSVLKCYRRQELNREKEKKQQRNKETKKQRNKKEQKEKEKEKEKEKNLGSVADFKTNGFGDEFLLDQFVEVDSRGNALHDFNHFGADFEGLGGLGV